MEVFGIAEPHLVAIALNADAEIAMVIRDDGGANGAATNHDFAKKLSRAEQREVVYVDVPENIARHSMRQLGVPASLVEGLLGECRRRAAADAPPGAAPRR